MVVKCCQNRRYFEHRTRLESSRSCSLLLVCAIVVASSGCAQLQPSPPSDPIERLDNIMDSSGYFFPRHSLTRAMPMGRHSCEIPLLSKEMNYRPSRARKAYGKRNARRGGSGAGLR